MKIQPCLAHFEFSCSRTSLTFSEKNMSFSYFHFACSNFAVVVKERFLGPGAGGANFSRQSKNFGHSTKMMMHRNCCSKHLIQGENRMPFSLVHKFHYFSSDKSPLSVENKIERWDNYNGDLRNFSGIYKKTENC